MKKYLINSIRLLHSTGLRGFSIMRNGRYKDRKRMCMLVAPRILLSCSNEFAAPGLPRGQLRISPSRWETLPATYKMDNSPTSLFDSYEQDFKQIISSIKEKLEGDAKDQQGGGMSLSWVETNTEWPCCGIEQRKTALRRVEMELDEADEMVRGLHSLS